MTGQKYIDLVDSQFGTNNEETLRCAISRYYYGLLHLSIDRLVTINTDKYDYLKINIVNPPYQGYSIHGATFEAIKAINPAIGADFDIVRKLRVLSDYNFDASVLNQITISYNFAKNKHQRVFQNVIEIKTFLDGVLLKITTLNGSEIEKGEKISADISGLLAIKKKLLPK